MGRKLFVSDLDGTLLKIGDRFSAGVSEENRKAVQDFVAKGNIFAVATARDGIERLHFEDQLGFVPDLVGGNGAVLKVCGHEERVEIDPMYIMQVRDFLLEQDLPATLMCYSKEHHYCQRTAFYPFVACGGPRDLEKRFYETEEMPEDLSELHVLQFMTMVAPRDLDRVRTVLQREFSDRMEITSSDVDLLGFSPRGCTKGNGILKLAEFHAIAKEDIAVIGDSENDISMIKAVKHGYCMEHAESIVQACAYKSVASVGQAMKDFMGEEE